MNYSKLFRTALLSLVAVFAFGFGLTSCVNEKTPAELIIGTWTLNAEETYLNDALIAKQDLNTNTIEYYVDGKLIKTDTIDAYTVTLTFDEDKTCAITYYDDDEAERTTCTYSLETVNGEKRLLLTEDGETEYAVINTLKKKELILTAIKIDDERNKTYKTIFHFKK